MGLLDVFNSDEGRMALGLLAAAGPSSQPMSFGQRLAGAMSQHDAYLQHKQAAAAAEQDRQLKAQMIQAQIADMKAQEQQRIGQAQDIQRKAAEQARISGLVRNAFAPTQAIDANTASGVSGPRPEALGVVGQRPQVNYQDLIAQGVPPEYVQKLAESRNYGRDKVARTVDGKDEQGRPVTYQLDDFGVRQGTPIQQWKAPEKIDTGGQIGMLDPVTMKILTQFKKTQTPGEVASTGLGYARLAHDKQQAANSAAAGQLIETPEGYVRVSKDNRATAIMAPTGVQPLMGNGSKLPEAAQKQVLGARNVQQAVSDYQAKLATWSNSKMLSPDARAEMGNAYNNMMLQAKEAYNLGVLNGPDYAILQSVVKDPTKLTSIATSNEALSGQAGELSRIASNIEKNALNAHGKKYTPFAPNKPAPTSGGVDDLVNKYRSK